jgi:hypothetical protein
VGEAGARLVVTLAAWFQAITSQVAVRMTAGLGFSASSTRCSLGVTPSFLR